MLNKKAKKLNRKMNRQNQLFSYTDICEYCKSEGISVEYFINSNTSRSAFHNERPAKVMPEIF